MKNWAYIMILLAAFFWGVIGLFVQGLFHMGLTSFQIVTVRMVSGAMILLIYLFFKNRSLLKIRIKDWPYFIGTGIVSYTFFNWCYFTAIKENNLSIAAILLYTAPFFVAIFSRLIFKERFTFRKAISLSLAFIGIGFVVGILPNRDEASISLYGIVVGLGSGIGYALYSIFGKAALVKYHPVTITTYTFVFASIATLPFSHLWENTKEFYYAETWIYIVGIGFFPTVLAVLLYTKGLASIESSKASIIATFEPVVATILGVVAFGDILTYWQIFGILLVLTGIIFVQETKRRKKSTN